VTGHISANGRTHSPNQPTFSGVLSADLVGKQDETLWPYLVSPRSLNYLGLPSITLTFIALS
jgi:hypothetical protein